MPPCWPTNRRAAASLGELATCRRSSWPSRCSSSGSVATNGRAGDWTGRQIETGTPSCTRTTNGSQSCIAETVAGPMFTESHAADPGTARPAGRQRIELRTDARATKAGPLDGRLRVLRVVALGGASMLLAAGAHLAAGGRLPSPGILVVTTFLVGLTAVTLTARRCRFGLLAIGLGVEQLILHEVFAASSMAWAPALHAAGGHDATGHMVVTDVPAGMATSPLMAAGHLVATLATVWLLAHGEDWLWGLGERA